MLLLTLLFLPVAGGLLLFLLRDKALGRAVLLATALGHNICAGLSAYATVQASLHGLQHGDIVYSFSGVFRFLGDLAVPYALGGLLQPDALGMVFLCLASLLFSAASVYAIGYLQSEDEKTPVRRHFSNGTLFTNAPEEFFLPCLCFFLAAMTLVTTTQHLGVLWVGLELTTLSSAPLIYFHRHQEAMEATWKYLMICSVGIALALIGNIFLSIAFYPEAPQTHNQIAYYVQHAAHAQPQWLKAAFIFFLVGFGTKMGLAPLHNWLPDAHSQAPSLVSALLSGALLNCAFLGILRGHQILHAAGLGAFSDTLLITLGLSSMLTAALFIVGQGHYKRLLAYSSVEHMGILALGVGLGGAAVSAAMLHAVCHSMTKCMLFLLAGNILTHYRTLSSHDVRGLRWSMPITAALWGAGFLAITGSPPFGIFVSEFSIVKYMVATEHWYLAAAYLGLLGVIFVGMSVPFLHMIQGATPPAVKEQYKENVWNVAPPVVLCALILCLGLYMPNWLQLFLREAAVLARG